MSRNDSYSGKRRNRKRESRVERFDKNEKIEKTPKQKVKESRDNRERKERDRKLVGKDSLSKPKIVSYTSEQKELLREIQKTLQQDFLETEAAIRGFKSSSSICKICGQTITSEEFESAMTDKSSDEPVHFDCILKKVIESEKPGPGEKISYIGQGKFAVLHFENPHDLRHFTIRRTIEWEHHEERLEWRNQVASLFSQIK